MGGIVDKAIEVARVRLAEPPKQRASLSEVAAHFEISRAALGQWGPYIPARHCRRMEALTDIPAGELNPDVFGPPGNEPSSSAAFAA